MTIKRLQLKIPTCEELFYRKRLLLDCVTMKYNKGYDEFDGYNKETGCIDFTESSWANWYTWWVGNTPDRFYAYIINESNIPVGEVALHYNDDWKSYCVSVIIEANHRGKGYGQEALELLLEKAFYDFNLQDIYDDFPASRISAETIFKNVGFKRVSNSMVTLSKEDYEQIQISHISRNPTPCN